MPSLPLLKALGLNFSPNQLEVAPGSLVEASNVIIRRDNVIESRRGYALYGTAMGSSSDRCKQLLTYKNKLIRHFSNRLQYEDGLNNAGVTAFFDFDEIVNGSPVQATIEEAQAGLRIKSIEANSNLYLTTSEGIKKISAKSADAFAATEITQAGGVKALDAQASLIKQIGDQSSFLSGNSGVAYKIVWGTKDASNNLILGTPSDPVTILNPLIDLTLQDFSNFLLQLDNTTNAGSSLLTDTNYYATFALPLTATSVELRDNLILLAKKIDEDLLFANAAGTGAAYQQLGFLPSVATTATTTSGNAAITVALATGIQPGMRIAGTGVYGTVVSVVGTTVTLSNAATANGAGVAVNFYGVSVSSGITSVYFNSSSTPSNYFISGDKINIPVDSGASILGFTSGTSPVSIDGLNGTQVLTAVNPSNVLFTARDYSTTNFAGVSGTITNITAAAAPGSVVVTSSNHGLKSGQRITISGTTVVSPSNINGVYTVTYLTPDTFSIPVAAASAAQNQGVWDILVDGISSAKIESYELRSIEPAVEQSIPATAAQLASVQEYYASILIALQDFIAARGSNIVAFSIYTSYLESLDSTTAASVKLKITIPSFILQYTSATNPYFYQVYRTDIAVIEGVSTISDISIIQEYTQIEEKFPTSSELSTGVVEFIDNTPESIAGTGANLYTNERSGEGGLQANDLPPFALDINLFRGHVFYSNTRTRQRKTITLLGVVSMINAFNPSDPYKITISNGIDTETYSFVTGLEEVTQLTCGAASGLASTGASSYFLLNSANDETQYYVWYQVGTSTDPAISGKTGIKVVALAGDLAPVVAQKTKAAISNVLSDFTTSILSNVVTITNVNVGSTTNASLPSPIAGFSIATTQEGRGEDASSNQVLLSSNISVSIAIEETAKSFVRVINENASSFINAFYVSGTNTTPGTILLESKELDLDEFYILGSDSTIGASFNPEISPGTIAINSISIANPTVITTLNHNFLPADVNTGSDVITILSHGFLESSKIIFSSTGTLPSPLVAGTTYYVKNATANSFQVSTTPGSGAIDLTTSGTGTFNVATPHELLNGEKIIITNSNSTPSINGVYQITYLSTTSFSIPVNVTGAGSAAVFEPILNAEGSSNEEQPHRVYYSKFQQPEAVPILNYLDVGATDKAVLRIFPLRDSLFVFKEDGLFRISGEVAPFSVALFDSSCILLAPDSVTVANNQVYGWTTQGISTVTEAGVNIISRSIDTEILRKASSQFTNFKSATWGIGYESDNSYTVYTTSETTDTRATIGFRYSNLTNSWTTVDRTATAGILNPADDKLYLGAGDTNYLEKERKEFTRYDYADRELSFQVVNNALSGSSITLSTVSGLAIGDVVVQDQTLTVYEFNMLLQKLDIDPGIPSSDYYSTLAAEAGDDLRSKLEALAIKLDGISGSILTASASNPCLITTSSPHGLQNGQHVTIYGNSQPSVNQQFNITVVSPTQFTVPINLAIAGVNGTFTTELTSGYATAIASLTGGIANASIANPTVITTSAPHGLQTGRRITISGNSESEVNGNFEATVTGLSTFTIPVDLLAVGTGGSFITIDENFEDIKTCYNIIISRLNADPIVSYSNYRSLDNNTIQEAIISSINLATKTITLNLSLEYVVGAITIYKAIPCRFTYSPLTMGDPLGLKHMREATIMFANKAFTAAKMEFSTDLLPEVLQTQFNGDGNGIFGHQTFGSGFFGGGSNAAPFRTFIPRQCQRCRYLNIGFSHSTAREQYAIYGITLTGEVGQSTRAYR